MKILRNILLVTGILFVIIDVLLSISLYQDFKKFEVLFENNAENIGYMLGSQIFLIIAIVLFFIAYRVQKRINKKKRKALEDSFNEIGWSES